MFSPARLKFAAEGPATLLIFHLRASSFGKTVSVLFMKAVSCMKASLHFDHMNCKKVHAAQYLR